MTESDAAHQVSSWSAPSFDDEDPGPGTEEPSDSAPDPAEFIPTLVIPSRTGGEPFDSAPQPPLGGAEPAEPDFAAMKFLRENTLLSNAEKYAASIREEAELYVAQMRREVDHLNREAEARYEEARLIREEAERQAEQLIAEGQAQVSAIHEQARREGRQAGEEEGIRRRYEEAQPYLKHLETILAELEQYRRQVAYYAEKDAIRLSVLMAKKVLWQELKMNKKLLWNLLAKTLATIEGQGNFKVWLNPEDFQFARQARPSLERYMDEDQTLTFRARPEIPPGNVQIETDREVIDLTLQNQFHYLENLLNQALAERETVVLKRPASATPSIDLRAERPADATGEGESLHDDEDAPANH